MLQNDISQCSIFLACRGNMDFDDTQPMTQEQYQASSEAIGRIQAKFDEAKLRQGGNMKLRTRSQRKRAYISSDEDDLNLEQFLEDSKNSKKKKETNENNMQKHDRAKPKGGKPEGGRPCSVVLKRLDDTFKDDLNNMSSSSQKNSDSDIENKKQDDKEKTDTSKTHKKKNNMQNFPISKAFRQGILKRMKTRQSFKTRLGLKSVIKAKENKKDGWHQVTHKLKRKNKMYTCPVKGCDFRKPVKAAVFRHIKKKHPKFRWKCRRCKQDFATKVGRYKHELRHKYGFRYQCNEKGCGYRCMFRSEMEEHCRKHSKSKKNWYKCRKSPDCDKSYPAKRSRNAHEKTHTAKDWTCEAEQEDGTTCGQECVSRIHLAQHMRGLHGPGWDSKCGKNFKWPSSKYSHESECTKCIKIKTKERKKPPLRAD